MLEFKNVRVYDLKESVIASRNAMRLEMPEYTDKEFKNSLERAKKLVQASTSSKNVKCHDNFLTGIRVSFDMKYTQYITKQFQRYHWFDYVSSSSLMHRITKMDFDNCCNKYVDRRTKALMKEKIANYNHAAEGNAPTYCSTDLLYENGLPDEQIPREDALYMLWMEIISNCPMGAELFVRVSTNYKQIQTIYWQRKNHKLKEDWGAFVEFVKTLPYSKELITGEE